MFSTLRLGRIFGIDTNIHWSFWILLLWIVLSALGQGGIGAAIASCGFVIAVFFCVYLHELGHAVTASRYGIRTIDISILPIGGLARLEKMPRSPIAEFWIAIAGPAVNVVIACFLLGILALQGSLSNLQDPAAVQNSFLHQLVAINVVLAVFNMLPALPMDGGRILRSVLQFRMSRLRATEVSARISRYLAGVLIVAGLIYSFPLVLVGIFVLIAGFQELLMARFENLREQGLQQDVGGFGTNSPFGDRPTTSEFPFGSIDFRYGSELPKRSGNNRDDDDDVLDATDVRRIP